MGDCSKNKNPLRHNGTSQAQRLLPGMDKNKFALVDEKSFAEWIVFANEFAAYVNYYSTGNSLSGNWQPFFSNDISAQLGLAAIQNLDRYKTEIKQRFDFISDDDNKSSINAIKIRLNELFSALLTLSKALDDFQVKLPAEATLKNSIKNLVKTKLAPVLKRLIAYYKAADIPPDGMGFLSHAYLNKWKILNRELTDAATIIYTAGLSNDWLYKTNKITWNDYVQSINPDYSIYNNPLTAFTDIFLSIEHAARHNLFTGIFDAYLATYAAIIKDAEKELLKTLEDGYDSHSPHYALFLGFLKLFRLSQSHTNTITQRHLDFYYKEVLRLEPKPAEANKVHILGELAKHKYNYSLPGDTALKAGKDSAGKDVTYKLDNETVFNKAKVAQLKNFYRGGVDDNILTETSAIEENNEDRLYASAVANSDDGNGAELTSANKEWHPYVHRIYKETRLDSVAMPRAQIGIALASHYLYLTEGERKVFIRFVLGDDNAALDGKHILCYLTTEKGWYQVNPVPISSAGKKLSDTTTDCAEISFTIPGSAPAIVNYNAKVHGGTYNVALPLLKIYLGNDSAPYEYASLSDITVSKVEIRVEVGMDFTGSRQKGLKNILLSNDFGALDGSRPFQAFGPQPSNGSGFVIGNKELFTKRNIQIKLNFEWKDLLPRADISYAALSGTETNYPDASVKYLDSGVWQSLISSTELFEDAGTDGVNPLRTIELSGNSLNNTVTGYDESYNGYGIASNKGFVKVQLTQSFGHKEYLAALTAHLISKANNITTDDLSKPNEPYTPTVQSLYASYSAFCTTTIASATTTEEEFNNREIKFFHIYPFGEAEQHSYLSSEETICLLPQFKHGDLTAPNIGEFYIGIEQLAPGESVNILFQLLEGTTDPRVIKPDEHIYWSYLGDNTWIPFDTSEYSDNTLELVQSGIISFTIPQKATTENTILPASCIWLRASITEAPEAVCKLITVNAQASCATFSDNDNAGDFLDTALPAGTVSKLKIPDAAIKKIEQPYPSFGGRPKENEGQFYIRVSERLRHKARAITIWDYEHLVLEAFPEIYKVKCLNHTQIEDSIYNEVKPGHVSIITIPALQNRNDTNPLKPYTQQSILTRIEDFLRPRTSCFVNLHARQPQFEEIHLRFYLRLHEQYTDFNFYKEKLTEEIIRFLSPWAFSGNSAIDFGGKVYKSVLINFIEEQYYVDFITDVTMHVKPDGGSTSDDKDEIIASTARSIIVSAPASMYKIEDHATLS